MQKFPSSDTKNENHSGWWGGGSALVRQGIPVAGGRWYMVHWDSREILPSPS